MVIGTIYLLWDAGTLQIQVHEKIMETSRELLMQIKELEESMGFEVLHAIVDCLWVIGEPISVFKEAVRERDGHFSGG